MSKLTPINQEVVLDLKAKTGNIESSIKSIIQKLQDTGLSDSFTKGYVSALQRILDKSQDLKKVISETNEVNSRTTTQWANSYNKLSSELTRTISRLENSSIDFNNLVDYDQNTYNKLIKNLETVKKAQTEIYSSSNVKSQSKLSLDPMIKGSQKLQENVLKNIDNEQQVGELIDAQIGKVKQELILAEAKKQAAQEQLAIYQAISKIDLSKIDGRTTSGKATLASAKALVGGTTKSEISANWKAQQKTLGSRLTKEVSKTEAEANQTVTRTAKQVQDLEKYKVEAIALAQSLYQQFLLAAKAVGLATDELDEFKTTIVKAANLDLTNISKELGQTVNAIQQASHAAEECTDDLIELERRQEFFNNLQGRVTQLFGLANAFQLVRRFVQEAWEAIKELDAAFTKIAVVTDKTTTELWDSFDMYNTMAQQLGVTTTDAIETSALYYQQGLETADVMVLTTETIKMAQIANMGFSEATKAMTAAIRGFKLEMTDANLVTDVYSALAAEAAVDTQELATAISKTASIAGNAGLSLQDTSAFLTQIIETTQEAAETAGTALKTIIARFTELKKNPTSLIVDVEGEEVSANKIEEALKTANVALRDTKGNFRDLGDVFLELSSKWDSLSRNTQRYIATTAAGSRQQSRFIAMMDDYKRTMELIGIANDSAGASEIQFAKTLDSVSSKVNKLKSNFEVLIGNLIQNKTVKGFLDLLNKSLSALVKISEKGLISFSIFIVTIGIVIKKLLQTAISTFQKVGKAWDIKKAEISRDILVKLHLDTTDAENKLNNLRAQATGQPPVSNTTVTPSTIPGNAGFVGPLPLPDTKEMVKVLSKSVAQSALAGMSMGLLAGVTSGDWNIALFAGLTTTISSVISNPAIIKGIGALIGKTAIGGALKAALPAIGSAISSAIVPIAITAAVVGLGVVLYKAFDPLEKAKKNAKKLREELEKAKQVTQTTKVEFLTEKENLSGLTENINKYEELSNKIDITQEEQEELNRITNELGSEFPQLIDHYDSANKMVLKQSIVWEEILKTQTKIAMLAQQGYGAALIKEAKAAEDSRIGNIEEIEQKIAKLGGDSYLDILSDIIPTNNQDAFINRLIEEGYNQYNITLDEAKKLASEFGALPEDINSFLWPSKDIGEINALKGQLNDLEKQASITQAAITNSYKSFAQGAMTIYSLSSGTEVDSNLFGAIESEIGEKLQIELQPEIDFDKNGYLTEEGKQHAQRIASTYLTEFQQELSNNDINVEKFVDDMADQTKTQFLGNLAKLGISNEPGTEKLYSVLLLEFETRMEGRQKLLDKLTEGMESDVEEKIQQEYLRIFGSDRLNSIIKTYGNDTGALYLKELMEGINSGALSEDIAEALAKVDLTTAEGARTGYNLLTGLDFTNAKNTILDLAQAMGFSDKVNEETIFSLKSVALEFNSVTKSASKALPIFSKLSKGQLIDDPEALKELIELYPQLQDEIAKYLTTNADATSTIALSTAIQTAMIQESATNFNESLNKNFSALQNNVEGSIEYNKALEEINFLLRDTPWEDSIVDAKLFEKAINGDVEALNILKTALENKIILEVVGEVDYQQLIAGASLAGEIAADKLKLIEELTGIKITAKITPAVDYGFFYEGGILIPETISYEIDRSGSTITNPQNYFTDTGNTKKNDYTTKIDKYFNEIKEIENLTNALEGLAEARDRGDLTPEEYRNNINQTAKYYKELQDRLHWYNEALRADQEKQATSINNAGYGDALKVVNGQLIANKDLIETLSSDTQEAIDEEIETYEKLSKTIKENSDAWWTAQEKKLKLLEESQNAYISLEQRVISILIKQDQEEIEQTKKKYAALKKADDDYLNALKDNINKRRKARAKEESYSDLSKKEKRLALLKRDTSGIYASEILSLEEEISNARRDISDTEVDDMVSTLEEKATKQAEANDKELEEMQNLQKDKEKSMLEYNKEVDKIMQSGAENVLKWLQTYDREYITASETAQQKYLEGWKNTINEANSYVDNVANGTVMTSKEAAATKAQGIYNELKGTTNTATSNKTDSTYATAVATLQSKDAIQALGWFLLYIKDRDGITPEDKQKFWSIIKLKHKYEGLSIPKVEGYYSKGGKVDYTGLAMVHGSKSNPESFLSAADTKNFLTLAQLLDSVISYKGSTPTEVADTNATTVMGDINISIEVAELANDYDVEQLADVIKQKIVDSSNYRNVNLISKVR